MRLNQSIQSAVDPLFLISMINKRKYDPKESVTSQLSDEAIHKIQNVISSELDGIDDLELGIIYHD